MVRMVLSHLRDSLKGTKAPIIEKLESQATRASQFAHRTCHR